MYRVVRVDEPAHRITVVNEDGGRELMLDGLVLEAQSAMSDGQTLLWVTDGSPYEEGLHIYLIARTGEVIDVIEAGAPYSPGLLEILSTSEQSVQFRFFRPEVIYRLEVAPLARLRWFLPNGFRYERTLSRHFLTVVQRVWE
ncbi:MAG TPA: hypothetical protein VFQ61_22380 [Polyangiaceae bacterium]|nr:hypothetical protein [Polyangiaceae bacterium]